MFKNSCYFIASENLIFQYNVIKRGVLTLEKENESEKIERLKQKIRDFNESMEELSEELTAIFTEGKEGKLHDVALEMIKSLDRARRNGKKSILFIFG